MFTRRRMGDRARVGQTSKLGPNGAQVDVGSHGGSQKRTRPGTAVLLVRIRLGLICGADDRVEGGLRFVVAVEE